MATEDSPPLVREKGETWYSFGHRHLEQRNMKKAAKCFIRATKQELGDIASACQWAGLTLGKLGRYNQGLRFLDRSLELDVDMEFRAHSHFGRALILNDLGQIKAATDACLQAYSLDRYDPTYMHLLGGLLNEDVIMTFGEKPVGSHPEKQPKPKDVKFIQLLNEISECLESREMVRARPLIERLIRNYPKRSLTKTAHALLLEHDGKLEEASELYVELSVRSLKKREVEEALETARVATKLMSSSPAAWLAYGRVQVYRGLHQEAEKAFRRGLRKKTNNHYLAELYLELGRLHYELNAMDMAEDAARKSIDADSNSVAWSLLGNTLLRQKRYHEGKEALHEADLLSGRSDVLVFLSLGLAHFMLDEKEECKERLREVFEVYSRGQEHLRKHANRRLGHILQGTKDESKSWIVLLEILQTLQAANALSIVAQLAIGAVKSSGKLWYYLHLTTSDNDEKENALLNAVDLEPDEPDIMLANIISFYDFGLKREAYDMLQQVPASSPAWPKAEKWMKVIEEEFEQMGPYGDYYDGW